MSVESAKAYFNKLHNDVEFRKKLQAAKDGTERGKIVRDGGFDFTEEEAAEARSNMELSDEQLDQVAGGWCGWDCGHCCDIF